MNSLCCRAGPCDQPANCIAKGACQYKSSSEERVETLLHPTETGLPHNTEWRLWWRGLNTGISPAGKTLKQCVEEMNAIVVVAGESLQALVNGDLATGEEFLQKAKALYKAAKGD